MKVLAVTCYTGDEKFARMTGNMLDGLKDSVPTGVEFKTSVVAQGCVHHLGSRVDVQTFAPHNVGFAFGMNLAIDSSHTWEPDFVLCLNNDLEFPNKGWLRHLIDIVEQTMQVVVPATDRASIRIQPCALDKPSFPVQESSAYCWLIPLAWCKWLKKTHGFWLFSEDFGVAYGEDNWTAFLLSKQFGPKVFRYVPRSFVKHLRARTSGTVKHDRKKSNRVLVDKLQVELQDPKLRGDLKLWAKSYVKILSQRL